MKEILLNENQRNILVKILSDNLHLKKIVESAMKITKNQKYLLNISDDDMNLIRDMCLEELQRIGFDKDYELTSEGNLLEDLSDIFYA